MLSLTLALALACPTEDIKASSGTKPAVEKGTVPFKVVGDQTKVPERYRLDAHTFDYEMELEHELPNSDIQIYHLRFPSPVESPYRENNTVHAEYYRPVGKGPFPGVVVLDITAGDQTVSRIIATQLAQQRIAALFVQMAYYGPRKPPNGNFRLVSTNLPRTIDGIRQTVLDVRRASAWLEVRPEVDPRRLGILGTSLGSFMGALSAEMEPRFARVVVLLGGGGLVDAYYDHPQAATYRKVFEALGGTKEKLVKLLAPVDPLTCASNLKDRKTLIIAGKRDDIVPPKMAEALWKATGEQKIVWYDCTHVGAALYFFSALNHVVEHFNAP